MVGGRQIFKNQVFPKQKGWIKTDIMGNIITALLDLTSAYSLVFGS